MLLYFSEDFLNNRPKFANTKSPAIARIRQDKIRIEKNKIEGSFIQAGKLRKE
ncbi:MAG: hypothetical protein IPP39_08170 [Chitinophagaceae bacterium]|nr:hypothetical protein [Chitinophagaceae bacterium]